MDLDLTNIDLSELAEPEQEESIRPGSDKSYRLARYWHAAIDDVEDEYKKWVKRGTAIERRYRDERTKSDEESSRRVNNLWANVEILYPALYGKTPQPIAERRFRDKDPAGRGAAQILERSLRNEIEISGYDEAIGQAVKDYLIPGRGTVWVRYEPEIGPGISIPVEDEMDLRDNQGDITDDESEDEIKLRDTGDRITRESTPVDYIQWTDFFIFPAKARIWKEVTAVGKRVYMTRDQMLRRFGEKIGKEIPLQSDDRDRKRLNESIVVDSEDGKKACVYEIWCRADEHVYWIAEGYDYLCDYKEDPLGLSGFFPIPRPLFANGTTNTLIPVPDFSQYQDQAIQIDELTQRIAMLAKACKVAGVYNAAADGIKRLLDESVENELIPVDDWAAFAEKGGVEGNLSLLPLKDIIGCMNELIQVKQLVVQEMDRLTGITDIIRGTTDARETLGAQRLKQNSQGTRLQRRQNEVARFARDTIRIMAEVMCLHFSPQSLIEVSGALFEEGLGVIENMSLETPGQNPGAAPPMQPQIPPGSAGSAPGPALGPPSTGAGPALSMPPTGGPPTAPGLPMVQGASPGAPGPQNASAGPLEPSSGMSQGMPELPPELMGRIEGLQRIAKAIQLLRNEKLRGFRVDIEVDSTIFGDSQQEKADRVEFIGAVTGYLEKGAMIAMQSPEITPLLGKILQFGVRGFRVGRDLEVAIEDFCDDAEKMAKQHVAMVKQNPQQNPATMKMQSEMMKAHAEVQKAQLDAQSNIQNAAIDKQRAEIEMQMKQMDMEAKKLDYQANMGRNQLEAQKLTHDQGLMQSEHDRGLAKSQVEMQKMAMERDNHARKIAYEQQKAELEMQLKKLDVQHQAVKHQFDIHKSQIDDEMDTAKFGRQMSQLDKEAQLGDMQHGQALEVGEVQHKNTMDEQLHKGQVSQIQRRQQLEKTTTDHKMNMEKSEADHKKKIGESLIGDQDPAKAIEHVTDSVKALSKTAEVIEQAVNRMAEVSKAIVSQADKLDKMADSVQAAAEKMNLPKEIVRDPKTGRATGVRTVTH